MVVPIIRAHLRASDSTTSARLVTELVAVARARGRKAIVGAVSRLRDPMDEDEVGTLDQAVAEWLKSVIADLDAGLGAELETAGTTREVMEVIKPKTKWAIRWYEDGVDDGREEGIKQGIEQGIVRAVEQQYTTDEFVAWMGEHAAP